MTDYAAEMETALQNLLGNPSEPFTGPEEPEEVRLVRQAMHCVKTSSSTNWEVVADILAEEVERLQAKVREHEQLKAEVRRLRKQNSDQGWELEARREAYFHERGRNTW